jgi:hypothetical protein
MNTDKHGLKTGNLTLCQKLDWLIDQWCERRALKPLRFLLAAYPGVLVHTDQFGDLLEKLRDVKGLCRSELTAEEATHVISTINELENFMKKGLVHENPCPSVVDLL